MFLDQVTPLILSFNEESNLSRTLAKLAWAGDIVVVDSFSEDGSADIAKSFAAVRFFQRTFDTHKNQWNFGLFDTEIQTQWVLALDADYVLTDQLITELESLQPEETTNGFSANFTYCINGKPLRSGIYPSVTVLYRRHCASYEQDGHTQRLRIFGEVRHLNSRILHDDRKPLGSWFISQARYTELEACKLLAAKRADLPWPDRLRCLCIVSPLLMFFYCLFVRRGILDGWAGFRYAFERTIAELMLSLRLIQHRLEFQNAPKTQEDQDSRFERVEAPTDLEIQNL